MTLYLDTSLLVAALTNETEPADAGLARRAGACGLAIGDWVPEFSAAISMKLRSGQIEAIHVLARATVECTTDPKNAHAGTG